jgi:hypothetical protein
VYIETVSSNSHEMSSILLSWHDEQTYEKSGSKLQKIRTKSEKHETCRDIMLSHVEVVCNSWEDFEQVAMCDAWNPDISTCDPCDNTLGDVWVVASDVATFSKSSLFLHTTYTCDNTTPRQVSWFSDFIRIFCNLETLFPYVVRHVTSTRCSIFHVSWWMRPRYTPNIMNIIFWITKLYYLMHMQFNLEVCQKIRENEKN